MKKIFEYFKNNKKKNSQNDELKKIQKIGEVKYIEEKINELTNNFMKSNGITDKNLEEFRISQLNQIIQTYHKAESLLIALKEKAIKNRSKKSFPKDKDYLISICELSKKNIKKYDKNKELENISLSFDIIIQKASNLELGYNSKIHED